MANQLVIGLLRLAAGYILGSGIIEKFEKHVDEQLEKQIAGADKKAGVKAALEKEGFLFTERAFNFGVELALQIVARKSS